MLIMLKTKTIKMGEINRKELVEYFLKFGGTTEDEETFKGPYWEVIVGPRTWTTFNVLKIRHVLITFNIQEDKFDDFIAAFHLNFLRCGG